MKKRKNVIVSIDIRKRRKIIAFFLCMLFALILLLLYMKFFVNPILIETGEYQIGQQSTKAINDAISSVLAGGISYDDLIHLVTDASGNISLIQANSVQINVLSRNIIESAYSLLTSSLDDPLAIPIGSFTGIPILTNVGPTIKFELSTYGDVNCSFISEFVSAGINQTQHKIYASVSAVISVVLPMNKLSVKTLTDVLVCESVIIGKIPETYLFSNNVDDMLNLVPD